MREKFLPAAQGRTKKLDHYPKLTGLFNSGFLVYFPRFLIRFVPGFSALIGESRDDQISVKLLVQL